MAEAKKKRQLKKVETVRERAERGPVEKAGKRRVKSSASVVSKPLRAVGKGIAKVSAPFAFVLKPFRTRPARGIGRIIAAILLFKFFRDAWKELRQVKWPNARETVRLTIAVFMFSLIFGVIVTIVDYGLEKVFKQVFIN